MPPSSDRLDFSPDEGRLLLAIARESIRQRLDGYTYRVPQDLPAALCELGAAFVTLRMRDTGQLRGCIGGTQARVPIAVAVAESARAAAFRDPRFEPLTADELPRVRIDVSCLSPMRAVDGPDAITPGVHGVTLELQGHRGLFLPQVATDQGWNRDQLLDGLCRKAGLPAGAWRQPDARFQIFTATVCEEE